MFAPDDQCTALIKNTNRKEIKKVSLHTCLDQFLNKYKSITTHYNHKLYAILSTSFSKTVQHFFKNKLLLTTIDAIIRRFRDNGMID